MIKCFATFTLLFSGLSVAQSQDGFIKYQKDSEYRNKSIRVIKSEILPYINAKPGKIDLIFGSDTITEIEKASDNFVEIAQITHYDSLKDELLQKKGNGTALVQAKNIPATDTVTLMSESGKQITQLITQREAQVNLSDLGKTSRLIISNSPTVFYSIDKLKQYAEAEPVQRDHNTGTSTEGNTGTDWEIWQKILLGTIVIGIFAAGGFWFLSKRVNDKLGNLTSLLHEFKGLLNNTSQLHDLKSSLIKEIQSLKGMSSANGNQIGIHDWQTEKAVLKDKLNGLEIESKSLNAIVGQLQVERLTLESTIKTLNDEKSQIQTKMNMLNERVLDVKFLKGYSESVFSYLDFCQEVTAHAYTWFNRISQQNSKHAIVMEHLLMSFQASTNSIPVGNWQQTVQDIRETGTTTRKELVRSFSQIQNESEKQKEFQRLLFKEVVTKYSSNILILAEAFRNLSRFQVSTELSNEIQDIFGRHVKEIVSKAKATGLEIKYVSLFKSFEEYLGQIESIDSQRSLAYKEVSGLQRNQIAEINSFGVRTEFEDSKTYVILA